MKMTFETKTPWMLFRISRETSTQRPHMHTRAHLSGDCTHWNIQGVSIELDTEMITILIAASSLVVHYQLTWVSFLPLQTIFSMLSVGSGNARNSWDPTVLRSNWPDTSVEEQCCCEEVQPPGGLSERTEMLRLQHQRRTEQQSSTST